MTRQVLASYLALTAFMLAVLAVPLGITVARAERAQLVAAVERDGAVLAGIVEDVLEQGSDVDLTPAATEYADRTGARVVIVGTDGVTVGDSDPPSDAPRDFSTRPEIAEALEGRIVSGDRFSETLDTGLLYVAVPVTSGGEIHGAVRITYPTAAVDARIRQTWLTLAGVGGVTLLAAAVVGLALARSVTRPVQLLHRTAARLAAGDLSARADDTAGPSELRGLSTAMNGMASRLEALLDSQRAFVADASHQLRSPLTALRLRLEGIDRLDPAQQEQVEAAIDETARLSRLIDGLLTLASAEGARTPPVAIEVAPLLHERASAWEAFADETEVRLDVDAHGTPRATALPGALEQVVDNYLANAFSVVPSGSTITLRCEGSRDHVVVSVVDQGPGMPAEQRQRAFDRFWRGNTDDREGFGLGLAIVSELATASGGRAELREGPGGVGVEAIVLLPAASQPASDDATTAGTASPESTPSAPGN